MRTWLWLLAIAVVPVLAAGEEEVFTLRQPGGTQYLVVNPQANIFCWQIADGLVVRGNVRQIEAPVDGRLPRLLHFTSPGNTRLRLEVELDRESGQAVANLRVSRRAGEWQAHRLAGPVEKGPACPCAGETAPDAKANAPRLDAILALADERNGHCAMIQPRDPEATAETPARFCWVMPQGKTLSGVCTLRLEHAEGVLTRLTVEPGNEPGARLAGSIEVKSRRGELRLSEAGAQEPLAAIRDENIDDSICACGKEFLADVPRPAPAGPVPSVPAPAAEAPPPPGEAPAAAPAAAAAAAAVAPVAAAGRPPVATAPAATVGIVLNRGQIVPQQPFTFKVSILSAGLTYGGDYKMPITAGLLVDKTLVEPWGFLAEPAVGDVSRGGLEPYVLKRPSPAGTALLPVAQSWRRSNPLAGARSSLEAHVTVSPTEGRDQVWLLRHGDPLPPVAAFADEAALPAFLRERLRNGRMYMPSNHVLVLFELGLNARAATAGFRDLALLVAIFPAPAP